MQPKLKQLKTLIIALFLSGTLNIFLLAFTFFFAFWDRPPTPYCELKPKVIETFKSITLSPTNADLLAYYKTLTHEQLMQKLSGTRLVEDGFKERDLALAALTTFHDFDLEKALGNRLPEQKRILSFKEGQEKVIAYPTLSDEQFSKLETYIKTEKWPFKSFGLFLLMKKDRFRDESSLFDAFRLTSEFIALENLFKKTNIAKEDLLKMVQEGEWSTLSAFYEKQKNIHDLSDENRQRVLLSYLKAGSKTSAKLLLKTDFQFASKRLSDSTVLAILRLLDSQEPLNLQFLNVIRMSPRSDAVKLFADTKHLELTGKPIEPLVSRSIKPSPPIQKVIPFTSKKTIAVAPVAKTSSKKMHLIYVVQEGDSLWKIGKKFKVPIDKIRSLNQLKTDFLKPGTALKIPHPS